MYRIILFLIFFTGCSIVDSKDAAALIGTWKFTEQQTTTIETTATFTDTGRYTFKKTQTGVTATSSEGTYLLGSAPPRQVIVFFNNTNTDSVSQMFFFVDDDTGELVTSVHANFLLPQRWTRQ